MRKKRIPRILQERPQRELEEFVGIYFPSGNLRDAARRLWRALETGLHLDLSGLHPDDDLSALLDFEELDSLEAVELVMALEEALPLGNLADTEDRLGSFRSCVERIARNSELRRR